MRLHGTAESQTSRAPFTRRADQRWNQIVLRRHRPTRPPSVRSEAKTCSGLVHGSPRVCWR